MEIHEALCCRPSRGRDEGNYQNTWSDRWSEEVSKGGDPGRVYSMRQSQPFELVEADSWRQTGGGRQVEADRRMVGISDVEEQNMQQ